MLPEIPPLLHQRPMNLLSTAEVADHLGVSVPTVVRMAKDGRLTPATKLRGLRGAYMFEATEVDKVPRATRPCSRCGIATTKPDLCRDCSGE